MKKTDEIEKLRAKTKKELFHELEESEKKLMDLRFKANFKKLKNYKMIKSTSKRTARIWTVLTENTLKEDSGNN